MSQPRPPKPAKLVIGFFLKEKRVGTHMVKALVDKYGAVDLASSWKNHHSYDIGFWM